ncbi:MAG: electron transfer flavoprotein subunit alpha/FixB family protein [Acidobacteria bacterium]|nr:electron transfer flavoprotein subunit alpha/FixB family protein [Acidobacteriota bacterium]MBV9436810.1 electron transfer flavoprotein subunit alpha/FixB family protein [Acidobacteriota bacterium]
MPEILIVAEQREGKFNRVSLETLAGAQAIAAETGWTVEAAVVGSNLDGPAQEVAKVKLAKVYAIEAPALEHYTADAYVAALKQFISSKQPRLVLMPHTYQVRDFAPKLAASLGRTLISDSIGYRKDGDKLVFTRQMFQGKFAADVSFSCDPPHFATFQAGAFRVDKAEMGAAAAAVERVSAQIDNGAIRVKPLEIFKEAKQAVDLTQAEIIVSVGRGIKEPKNIDLAKALAEALGGEIAASRPICDSGWLPMDRQIGSSGQTVAPKLYLALGISGAIQHIVGMKGSRSIIAINKDAEAPIFEIADYGVVGNLFDIVPTLTEEVRKAKA